MVSKSILRGSKIKLQKLRANPSDGESKRAFIRYINVAGYKALSGKYEKNSLDNKINVRRKLFVTNFNPYLREIVASDYTLN